MKWKPILAVLLILSLTFVVSDFSEGEAQAQYSLNLLGITWDHSTISVLIIPQESELWWEPSYLNATLRAIGEWNNAILDFASNYSIFTYLSRLRIAPTVTHALDSGFDVYITWIEESAETDIEAIGFSKVASKSPCIIINNTISLAAKIPGGYVLNEVDMQNVALHELGHGLGLDHSNYPDDIMYPNYTSRETVHALSTLDVYAVSRVFEWMAKSPQFNPPNTCPQKSPVTLPSSIPYRYLPISYEDLPPLLPSQTPLDYILRFILRPEFLIALLIPVTVLIVLVVARRRRKEAQETLTEDTLFQETVGFNACTRKGNFSFMNYKIYDKIKYVKL